MADFLAGAPSWLMANIMAVLIGLGAASLIVFSLLGDREMWDLDEGEGLLARLRKRRERLLRALKDLETERDAGTLAEAEFFALRADFKRRAIAASRELERVRHARLREIEKGRRGLAPSQKKRIEDLVKSRKEKS